MSKWCEPSGEVIYNCVEVLEKFAKLLQKDIAMIAEKHRDLGFVNENLEATAASLSVNHYPKAKQVLSLFISALDQIEYARKVMYTRTHDLSESAFANALEQAKTVKSLLKARDQAASKYLRVMAAKQKLTNIDKKKEMQLRKITTDCQGANSQALFGVSKFAQQVHKDLVMALSSFAHAQMELYTHVVEVFGKTIEEIDQVDLEEDIDKVTDQMQKILRTIPA